MGKVKEVPLGWWGERWQAYLMREVLLWMPSEAKLRSAQKAEVSLHTEKGRVEANVAVGRWGKSVKATLRVRPWTAKDWRRALEAIATNPDVAHRLLSGAPGPELEQALMAADVRLFPEPYVNAIRCSCSEAYGCRHINVLIVHSATLFDANPFLWLEILGHERTELLASVRAKLADLGGGAVVANESALTATEPFSAVISPERFWATDFDPDAIVVRPGAETGADGLLRLLGPLQLPDGEVTMLRSVEFSSSNEIISSQMQPVEEVLRGYALQVGQEAAALARGERMPEYRAESASGKAVPLRKILALEVAEAGRQAGAPVRLDQLRELCPTANALPDYIAKECLSAAMVSLPEDVMALAGWYVCPRATLLSGAAFRHVVTYAEAQSLRPEAGDWQMALEQAGLLATCMVQVGDRIYSLDAFLPALAPEVGDELWFTVVDPVRPVLVARLVRRSKREWASLLEANKAARKILLHHFSRRHHWSFEEREGVAVLLAEGRYRVGSVPDPLWLFSVQVHERYYGHWVNQEGRIKRFCSVMAERGQKPDMCRQVVSAWCKYWPGEHDAPGRTPSRVLFLEFLWNEAPKEVAKLPISAERFAQIMAAWFTFLGEEAPVLKGAYREHVAICQLIDAFQYRCETLPGRRSRESEILAWQLEGCRWMGPHCYPTARTYRLTP